MPHIFTDICSWKGQHEASRDKQMIPVRPKVLLRGRVSFKVVDDGQGQWRLDAKAQASGVGAFNEAFRQFVRDLQSMSDEEIAKMARELKIQDPPPTQ